MSIETMDRTVEQQYFDQLQVIRTFERDMQLYNCVQPETRQRFYNEEVTFYAEALDAPMTSSYEYAFDGSDFYNVDGTSLSQMLSNGFQAAKQQSFEDYRKTFEADRAEADLARIDTLVDFMHQSSNESLVVITALPEEAIQEHGASVVQSIGYQPDRALAFIRVYEKADDMMLRETCVSVDSSKLEHWNELRRRFGLEPSDTTLQLLRDGILMQCDSRQAIADIVHEYDQLLAAENADSYRQGRRCSSRDQQDGWEFIQKNDDLIHTQLDLFEDLAHARTGNVLQESTLQFVDAFSGVDSMLPASVKSSMHTLVEQQGAAIDDATLTEIRRAITYTIAASLKARHSRFIDATSNTTLYESVTDEMYAYAQDAIRNMEEFIGCGGVQSLFDEASFEEMQMAGLASSETYAFNRKAHCISCDPKAEKPTVACGPCNICWSCDIRSARIGKK